MFQLILVVLSNMLRKHEIVLRPTCDQVGFCNARIQNAYKKCKCLIKFIFQILNYRKKIFLCDSEVLILFASRMHSSIRSLKILITFRSIANGIRAILCLILSFFQGFPNNVVINEDESNMYLL